VTLKRTILLLVTLVFLGLFTVPTLMNVYRYVYGPRVHYMTKAPERIRSHPGLPRQTSYSDMGVAALSISANCLGVFSGIWLIVDIVRKRRNA